MSALTELFTNLANKIRSKLGTSTKYTPAEAISAIDDVYDKGLADGETPTQTKTVTAGTATSTVVPDDGYALSEVTVNPTPSETKSASPSTSAQTITPTSGKLLSSVSVSAISPVRTSSTLNQATASGVDSNAPYVYFPYGWWPKVHNTYGAYVYMTAAQAQATHKHTTTYTPTSRSAALDMGEKHAYRYVKTTSVPNTNSGTYTYASGSKGATADLGADNTYRYVNAANVYAKGKADAITSAAAGSFNYNASLPYSVTVVNGNFYLIMIESSNSNGYDASTATISMTGATSISNAWAVYGTPTFVMYACLVKATSTTLKITGISGNTITGFNKIIGIRRYY